VQQSGSRVSRRVVGFMSLPAVMDVGGRNPPKMQSEIHLTAETQRKQRNTGILQGTSGRGGARWFSSIKEFWGMGYQNGNSSRRVYLTIFLREKATDKS